MIIIRAYNYFIKEKIVNCKNFCNQEVVVAKKRLRWICKQAFTPQEAQKIKSGPELSGSEPSWFYSGRQRLFIPLGILPLRPGLIQCLPGL
jgi:hypothetical protein